MKLTIEHYDMLALRIAPFYSQIAAHKQAVIAQGKAKNIPLRILWDIFHAAGMYKIYSPQEFDYKDMHIETAMRSILKRDGVVL